MLIGHRRAISVIYCLLLLLWLMLPGTLWAEDALRLEEIIVTATKREASLQDVAVAVTAVPDWVLKDNQIIGTAELTNLVPSLTLQEGENARQSSFNIRGIGTRSFSTAVEPSVSTVVDGVVMGRSGQAFGQLLDVQRVEVLRGPQGTLFGKNASAGAVHIITKNPSQDFEADASIMAIEQDEYRFGATVAGPITPKWSYRLTGSYLDDRGYTENLYDPATVPPDEITFNDTQRYLNGGEDTLIRGKLRWEPTTSIDVQYTGDWQKNDRQAQAASIRYADDPNLITPVNIGEENDEVNIDGPTFANSESYGHALELNADIGNHILTSITAYRSWKIESQSDVDARPILVSPPGLIQLGETQQRQFTQELRVASPADQRVTYVAGLFFFDQTVDRDFDRTLLDALYLSAMSVDTRNYAAFGEATWNMAERWRLIFGGRYTYDDLSYDFVRSSGGPFSAPVNPGDPGAEGSTDNADFSGKLALQWDFSSSAMTYLSYAQGYKGPAYDIGPTTDVTVIEPVDPETSDAYEWGLKSSWLDNRLTFNLAAFYTRFKDWQAEAFIPDETGESGRFALSNAGKVSTRGVEVDLTAIPVRNLTLYTAVAHIRARIDEFQEGPCNFQQQGSGNPPSCLPANGGVQDLSGGDMPFSPDWRVTVSANYLLPLQSLPFGLAFTGTYRWQSEELFDVTQDPNTVQDAYGILDLAMSLRSDSEHHDLTFFVKNVADQFYVNSIAPTSSVLVPGGYLQRVTKYAHRTAGVEYRFSWF